VSDQTVIVLTALRVEYQAVRQHLTDLQEEVHERHTVYERGLFQCGPTLWHVGLAEIGAGNAGAAMEAERAISLSVHSLSCSSALQAVSKTLL